MALFGSERRHGLRWIVSAALTAVLLLVTLESTLAFRSSMPTSISTNRNSRMSSTASSSCLSVVPLIADNAAPLAIEAASTVFAAGSSTTLADAVVASGSNQINAGELLGNSDFLVFVAGIFPFMWATYEFWRRIMFGESFGTGTDSIVIIGKDDAPFDSRGRRVLGTGALVTAYVLFVCAFGTLAVVGYSVATSAPPSSEDLAAVAAVESVSMLVAP